MRVLLVAFALSFCASLAHAQSTNWSDGRARFSVSIPDGWRQAEGTVPVSGEKLLVIQSQAMIDHVPAPRTFFAQECSIGRTLHPDSTGDQSHLNAMLEDGRLLEFLIMMAFPSREHSRGNELVQDVRVVGYDIEVDVSRGPLGAIGRVMQPDAQFPEIGPYRLMMRMFQTPDSDGAAQYILVCQAFPVAGATNEIADMRAFLSSLTFSSGPSD
jgi:hypothetical protein